MALSIFDDKSAPPTEAKLRAALGPTFTLWQELVRRIAKRFPPLDTEWGFSSKTTGWGFRLKHRDRAIVYLVPRDGHFLASFALGEKAVAAARKSDVPAAMLAVIDRAPKYAEGRGVRFEVRRDEELQGIETIACLKMNS